MGGARCAQLRLAHREVKGHFVLQVLFQPSPPQERADALTQAADPLGHGTLPQVASKTRLIAVLVRRHDSVVSFKRLRPLAVSR